MSTQGFKVCLPGNFELDACDADAIMAVHANDAGDGSFIVEFKNEQDATRYLKLARKARKAAAAGKAAASSPKRETASAFGGYTRSTAGLWSSPAVPTTTTSATSSKYEVEVSGLPKHLMNPMMLEATLEQAGLEKNVLNISLVKSGKVQIIMSNRRAADACLEHFHGRNWNPTGGAVSAKIVSEPLQPKKEKIPKAMISNSFDRYAPAYIHSSIVKEALNTNQALLATSDASTTVSDEDVVEQESWEADLKKVMSGYAYE
jgi:hypothetical protein